MLARSFGAGEAPGEAARRDPDDAAEVPVELALVVEADRLRRLRHPHPALEQLFGPADAHVGWPRLPGGSRRDRPPAMKATVYVRLKQEVLDPQGDAVKRALDTLGFAGVKGVRVGKLIEIELDPGSGTPAELQQKLGKMADEMLANSVIEDYEIKVG
jgi:phosphoribosylformylglycinamidine synthase subunit PurS